MPETGFIKVTRDGAIAIVTLDHPPVNALTVAMIEELGAQVDALDKDAEVGAIILTGAGNNAFCTGGDVQEMATIEPSKGVEVQQRGQDVAWAIEHASKPTICALNGMALGGGLEFAMACDIRISTERARFGQPEVNLGMIPGYGGTQRLAHLIGPARAKELIFTGRMVRAPQALEMGLVNQVVPDGEELRAAKDLAMQILSKAPLAVKAAKRAIADSYEKPYRNGYVSESQWFAQLLTSEDLKEGIKAFLEKRQPKWQGK